VIWLKDITTEFDFLSSAYPCNILYNNKKYKCSGLAYVDAIKDNRSMDTALKIVIMTDIISSKFSNKKLRKRLLDTGDRKIIMSNMSHDNLWGICLCSGCGHKGSNYLGSIIMAERGGIRLQAKE
jgi:predicted NAD-dependent protein-ADP-ribosyltransferase YbiA (DUF1768 family)